MTKMQELFGEQLAGAIELFLDSRCAGMDANGKAYMIGMVLSGWHLPCGRLNAIGAIRKMQPVVLCQIDDGDTFFIWSRGEGWL